jgi:hypothetical protein
MEGKIIVNLLYLKNLTPFLFKIIFIYYFFKSHLT